jgi:hypothetical protein
MDRLCMIIHLTTVFTPCMAITLVSYTCIFVIDHEEPLEPAPVEAGNHEQDQGKPRWLILSKCRNIMIIQGNNKDKIVIKG